MDTEKGRQRVQAEARRSSRELSRKLGGELQRLRVDCGLSQAQVARVAGLSQPLISMVENAKTDLNIPTLCALAGALGASLTAGIFPGTGPAIRDHIQAQIVEAFLRILHRRWRRFLEVPVHRPVRGVIDLVLHEPDERVMVASEAQSELRRLEQQLRWGNEKATALASSDLVARLGEANRPSTISTLLLLRSTRATRELAATFRHLLATAYPAPMEAALEALTGSSASWPGPAIVWVRVDGSVTRILDRPPRGIEIGR